MGKRKLATVAMIGAALAASGCARIRNHMGYVVDEQLATAIQPGVDNKQSVQQTLGRPSLNSQFDDREWYYVSRNTKQFAFLQPKASDQKIVVVSFDQNGNVAKVEQRGMEKVVAVNPSSDKTPTLGRETGILEDLFGNIGSVGAAGGGAGGPPQ